MNGRKTLFSPDRVYRYQLWREWQLPKGLPYGGPDHIPLHSASEFVMFIGLNPSTADEMQDDPTVRRCVGFSKRWGYGALCMTNLFAFRATNPKDMMAAKNPVGPFNDNHLDSIALEASVIVCAWGRGGEHQNRESTVVSALWNRRRKIKAFGFNKDGSPKHPLYLSNEAELVPMVP